jgi:hypothetical protein
MHYMTLPPTQRRDAIGTLLGGAGLVLPLRGGNDGPVPVGPPSEHGLAPLGLDPEIALATRVCNLARVSSMHANDTRLM